MDASTVGGSAAELAEAQAALDRILVSPVFVRSARQQRFLRYIVNETLAGRGDKIKGYAIGVEVFDREQAFDPAIDAIVRVEASRLRAKLREYYDGTGSADPLRFELPKGSYCVYITRPNSPHADEDTPAAELPNPIEDRPSLAVLPFINMSSDPEQEYFADGITDCLLTEVSRLPGLFVISRQSSFVYKKAVKRAEEIGKELGVRYLLEGCVQRAGEWVRITAQLIDATSGTHVWAERYDRELKDIFALQDDVTRRIATALQVKIASKETHRPGHEGTARLEAHDAFLRGLERFWLYTPDTTEKAKMHFANAVRIDPTYAAAHAWLARSLVFQWIFFWDLREEALEEALEHARAAIELDPHYAHAYAVLCWVQLWRRDGAASIAAGRQAVALDQNNADAYLFLSLALSAMNQGAEALQHIRTGMLLNPHPSTLYQLALGFACFLVEKYDEAIAAFMCGIELREAFIPNHFWLCILYTMLGRDVDARTEREKILALSSGRRPVVQIIWLEEALRAKMSQLVQRAGLA